MPPVRSDTGGRDDTPPYDDTHSSVPTDGSIRGLQTWIVLQTPLPPGSHRCAVTRNSVPTSVEAQDRFLDLLTATGCEAAVDADASEPSFLQYSKRTDVVRGRSGVQWTFGSLGKKDL